jgi:hypothetical protein
MIKLSVKIIPAGNICIEYSEILSIASISEKNLKNSLDENPPKRLDG